MMDDLLADDYELQEMRRSRQNDPIYELDQLFDGDPHDDDPRVRRKRNQMSLRYLSCWLVHVCLERRIAVTGDEPASFSSSNVRQPIEVENLFE